MRMREEGKWPEPAPDYDNIRGGDIILMHDDNATCVRELSLVLQALKNNRLQTVTVSELLALRQNPIRNAASTASRHAS